MSNKQDDILASIVQIVGLSSEAQGKVATALHEQNELLKEQNESIAAIPSRRMLVHVNLLVSMILAITIGIGTYITYDQSRANASIGEQNRQTVEVYCAAVPLLAECASPGSLTAKAGAILANCRIYANLVAVSSNGRGPELPSYAGCAKLGF